MCRIKKTILFIFLFFISTYCFNRVNINSKLTSVRISYIKGFIERPIPTSCGELALMNSSFIKDTILTDVKELNDIEDQLARLKEQNSDSLSSCDVRIQCIINQKDGKEIKLCIGNFNCLIKDNIRMLKNDTLIYLIRKYSGYYNYFTRNDLDYFNELKHFGIPENYFDLSMQRNLGLPRPPSE
jgi:hypothetical protein